MSDMLTNAIEVCGKREPKELPPSVWWMESDATNSYCHACAWREGARELGLEGREPKNWFSWDEQDRAINDRIRGGDPCGGESDHSEYCTTCGVTLNYHLTSYGASVELDHFLEHPPTPETLNMPEEAYALRRTLEACVWDDELRAHGETLAAHVLTAASIQKAAD